MLINMLLHVVSLILKISSAFDNKNQNYIAQFDESKSILAIKNFNSFSDLNLNYDIYLLSGLVLQIEFIPKNYVYLDSNLQFLVNLKKTSYNKIFYIKFSKIIAFNATNSLFNQLSNNYKSVNLAFYHSILNYSVNCTDNGVDGIFRHAISIVFAFSVKYLPNICPFVFKNTDLNSLEFHGISKSFLSFNQLDFDDTQDIGLLNSSIYFSLNLYFYKGILTKRMMIFKNAKHLRIHGMVDKIESESFYSTNIRTINFEIDNEIKFLSQGIEWMSGLNADLRINLNDFNETKEKFKNSIRIHLIPNKMSVFKIPYEFPDSDFCLYKDFPHDRLIFFIVKSCKSNCSCLLIWIFKNTCPVYNLLKIQSQIFLCKNLTEFNKKIKDCKFEQMIQRCNLYKKPDLILTNDVILYYSQKIEFFSVIISFILVSISFVSNSLSFYILIKVALFHYKNLNGFFYKIEAFMLANCFVNLLYLLSRFIYLLKKCVYPNSIFCPDFYYSYQSQLVEIALVDIMGNLFKFSSNFLQILVSIKRLMLLDPDFNIKINSIINSMINQVVLAFYVLIYIVILIASEIITTKINDQPYGLDSLENFIEYPNRKYYFANYLSPIQPISLNSNDNSSIIVLVFIIVNIATDKILTMILFFSAEMMILLKVQSNLRRKKLLKLNNEVKDIKKRKNINKSLNAVVFNLFFFIFYRALSIFIAIFVIYQKSSSYLSKFNICSIHHKVCTIVQEMDEIFFTFTSSLIFFFYFWVHQPFKTIACLFLKLNLFTLKKTQN